MDNLEQEVISLKKEILELKAIIKPLSKLANTKVALSDLATQLGKSRSTIRDYVLRNFEPDVDFQKENGKIMLNLGVVSCLKEKYGN